MQLAIRVPVADYKYMSQESGSKKHIIKSRGIKKLILQIVCLQSGQTEDLPRGDVVIALKWQPKTENTGNLSVLVKEAKNLAPVKNGSPSTFIKWYV